MTVKTIAIIAGKILALTILLLIFFMIGATISGLVDSAESTEDSGNGLGILLLNTFFQTVILSSIILRSRWTGWKLTGALFLAFFGSMAVIPQLESLVYLQTQMPADLIPKLVVMGAITAGLFSPVAVFILGKMRSTRVLTSQKEGVAIPVSKWILKLLVAVGVYLILYYSFGYFIAWKNPAVRAYYGGTDPGNIFAQMASIWTNTPWMFPFQAFRALLWVILVLPMIRMLRGRSWQIGLLTALFFAVWSLSLLVPNPYMPPEVARTHLMETITSNFIFGWFLGWLLGQPDDLR